MKSLIVILFVMLSVFVIGCTEQQRAKKYGGDAVVNLPDGMKLVDATWKGDDLWYLTRMRTEKEIPQSYVFTESSSWGVFEGRIVFNEK